MFENISKIALLENANGILIFKEGNYVFSEMVANLLIVFSFLASYILESS